MYAIRSYYVVRLPWLLRRLFAQGGNFRCEIVFFLLQPFTELEADEVLEHDLGSGILAGLVDDLLDRRP